MMGPLSRLIWRTSTWKYMEEGAFNFRSLCAAAGLYPNLLKEKHFSLIPPGADAEEAGQVYQNLYGVGQFRARYGRRGRPGRRQGRLPPGSGPGPPEDHGLHPPPP